MRKIKNIVKKVHKVFKEEGMSGVLNKIDENYSKIDVIGFYGYTLDNDKIPLNNLEKDKAKGSTVLNWVVPDLDIGSGGHMNIFRFITYLENLGMHNRIYLYKSQRFQTDEQLREFLKVYYNIGNDKIEIFCSVESMGFAHGTIATGWQTAYHVRKFDNTISKFYFIQDYEPYFYPIGSEFLLAENTYRFGFRGITAGNWLKKKLNEEYGMRTESYQFSYDHTLYRPKMKKDQVNRIFFYARPVTPRRSFELGLLALFELYKKVKEMEVIFAGWDVSNYEIPFHHVNGGNIRLEKLSDIYSQCDICLVMSTTNLSLLPLEIMASNSVVACTKGPHNNWLINEDNSIVLSCDPIEIANDLEYYLNNKENLNEIRRKGLEFAQGTSWDAEAKKVYDIIEKGIQEDEKGQ